LEKDFLDSFEKEIRAYVRCKKLNKLRFRSHVYWKKRKRTKYLQSEHTMFIWLSTAKFCFIIIKELENLEHHGLWIMNLNCMHAVSNSTHSFSQWCVSYNWLKIGWWSNICQTLMLKSVRVQIVKGLRENESVLLFDAKVCGISEEKSLRTMKNLLRTTPFNV
jgi:hypothetical protein